MKELTNEEISRVFAMYYPCDVLVDASKMHKGVGKDMDITKVVATFDAINKNVDINQFIGITYKGENGLWFYDVFDRLCRTYQEFVKPDFCKLLLTPLSKISDEDAIEVAKMKGYSELTDTDMPCPPSVLVIHGRNTLSFFHKINNLTVDVYQYLISKDYAVPLFFAPNHWANGKTAIELGIAIDKTTN